MQDVFIGTVRELLPLLGLVAIVLLVPALVLIYLFGRNPSSPIRSVYGFIQGGALWFALGIALIATIGSLFYSEILGFTPCLYCWYQRILMYPLVFIFATALVFKARDVAIYAEANQSRVMVPLRPDVTLQPGAWLRITYEHQGQRFGQVMAERVFQMAP